MNTRLVAARVLTRVLQQGESLTSALESVFQQAGYGLVNASFSPEQSKKDKAFVQALCYGVCRYYHRLDCILSGLVNKPIKDQEVKALLLVGLYQLDKMRVKPYAAVAESVAAMRQKPWAKALVNAVLRNYLRDKPDFDAKAESQRISRFNHPDWMISQLKQDWPGFADAILQANNQLPPMALRVNLSKISRNNYREQLVSRGMETEVVALCPSALVLNHPVSVEALPGFSDGWVSVQDIAAQLAAEMLDLRDGHRVLDVCAAPGGKAGHILESQARLAELVAVDCDALRMQRVRENFQRLKVNATLRVGDAVHPDEWWDGRLFDRILLDAPCSASGVIRRHPDIKLLRRPADIAALQTLQKNLLHSVWSLLRPGGILVYATCSVFKQENEEQMLSFLTEQRDAREIIISAPWGRDCRHGRQILPGDEDMDGFYYAKFEKHVTD